LNSNWFVIYKTDLKKKNDFLFKIGIWAESTARPSRPHHVHVAYAAQPQAQVGASTLAKQ
jgi:hypothetical protein